MSVRPTTIELELTLNQESSSSVRETVTHQSSMTVAHKPLVATTRSVTRSQERGVTQRKSISRPSSTDSQVHQQTLTPFTSTTLTVDCAHIHTYVLIYDCIRLQPSPVKLSELQHLLKTIVGNSWFPRTPTHHTLNDVFSTLCELACIVHMTRS